MTEIGDTGPSRIPADVRGRNEIMTRTVALPEPPPAAPPPARRPRIYDFDNIYEVRWNEVRSDLDWVDGDPEVSPLCVRHVRAHLAGCYDPTCSGTSRNVRIGHLEGSMFLGRLAAKAGMDIVDVADAKDGEYYEAALALFGKKGFFGSPSRWGDVLYIHHVYVKPEYRGAGLGAALIRNAIAYHDPTRLTGVMLLPDSQFGMPKDDPLYKPDRLDLAGRKKLSKFYASMGFAPIRDGYMYMDGRAATELLLTTRR